MAATPPCEAASPLPDKVTPGTNDSWDVVEGEDNGLAPLLAQAIDLPKEDDQVDQDYPYQVISSNTARGPEKQLRVHLLTVEGFCLGCGWRPRNTQMTVLTPGSMGPTLRAMANARDAFPRVTFPRLGS